MDGKNVPSPLDKLNRPGIPKIEIPKIPTKEEIDEMIKSKVPTEEELDGMAQQAIAGLVPNIPFFNFMPPHITISPKKSLLIDPFINFAKIHLLSRGGTMMVMAQYPPPAPPAPAVIMWQGYNVRNGPPVPPLIPRFPIPLGFDRFAAPEKGAVTPEQADKELEAKLNPSQSGSMVIGIRPGILSSNTNVITQNPSITNTISISGGQTITDKNKALENINKNKC